MYTAKTINLPMLCIHINMYICMLTIVLLTPTNKTLQIVKKVLIVKTNRCRTNTLEKYQV